MTKFRVATGASVAVVIDYCIKNVTYQCTPVVAHRYQLNNGRFRCPKQALRLLDEAMLPLRCEVTFEHAPIRLLGACLGIFDLNKLRCKQLL